MFSGRWKFKVQNAKCKMKAEANIFRLLHSALCTLHFFHSAAPPRVSLLKRPRRLRLLFHPARAGSRQHFARAQTSVGIKRHSQTIHRGQIIVGEHLVHEANFFHADAVFAGHAAAASDALVQNVGTGGQHAFNLFRIALVEQQNRMNVAIAGVKHIHDSHAVLFGRSP